MQTATYFSFSPDPTDGRQLTRRIWWSVGLHAGVVALAFVVPSSWLGTETEAKNIMTISLGGTPGPKSTGTTSIGGRSVERAIPPPPRPEPVRPKAPEPPAPVAAKPVAKPTPSPVATAPKPATPSPARPVATGAQVVAGNSPVETGARSQGAGLTFGGGGTGGETDLQNFCCPEYLQQVLATIDSRWAKAQQYRGTTVVRFTIRRDGTIDPATVTVFQSSGNSILDRASRASLSDTRFLSLPSEYTNPTLTIRLSFPYGFQ